MPDQFPYDAVRYVSHALPAMHPDRLFVHGRLFGLAPAPADRCRYLEVGGGTGTNVIAAAALLPGSEFVGLDLSATAVAEGTARIAELGLTNVRLEHADLLAWRPDGPFDYVCAHGVYSWVPAPVRDGLLALVRQALAPDGVGYVSYNTLPGCHLRRVIWDMLRFHTANVPDPAGKLAQCDQFLQFLCQAQEGRTDPPNVWVAAEADAVLRRNETWLTFHDELSDTNDPVYFLDFVGHAGRHALKFLAEADLPTMADEVFPAAVAKVLGDLGRQNPLVREQYRDFLKVRRFRATLVCHADRPTRPDPDPAAVAGLFASTQVRPVGDPADGDPAEFVTEAGGTATVVDPLSRRLLVALADRAPERVPVAGLVGDDPAGRLAVLTAARAGLVSLHGGPTAAVRAAGERPAVTRLARLQADRGEPVTTLLHTTLDLSDAASGALIGRLDGTRTRADLGAALLAAVPGLGTPEEVADGLEVTLGKLARAGMLVG